MRRSDVEGVAVLESYYECDLTLCQLHTRARDANCGLQETRKQEKEGHSAARSDERRVATDLALFRFSFVATPERHSGSAREDLNRWRRLSSSRRKEKGRRKKEASAKVFEISCGNSRVRPSESTK